VSVSEAAQTLPVWLLMGTFFACGYTSNGMGLTHFMPHAMDHNFAAMQASAALGMGAMNIIGTRRPSAAEAVVARAPQASCGSARRRPALRARAARRPARESSTAGRTSTQHGGERDDQHPRDEQQVNAATAIGTAISRPPAL
jgi:hypothetical protein